MTQSSLLHIPSGMRLSLKWAYRLRVPGALLEDKSSVTRKIGSGIICWQEKKKFILEIVNH